MLFAFQISRRCVYVRSLSAKPKNYKIQHYIKLTRDYWYVVLPIHGVTSAIWFAGCYFASNYFNVKGIIQYFGFDNSIEDSSKYPKIGSLTLIMILYKIMTPIRVGSTIYLTTEAIKYLSKRGVVWKPQDCFNKGKKRHKK